MLYYDSIQKEIILTDIWTVVSNRITLLVNQKCEDINWIFENVDFQDAHTMTFHYINPDKIILLKHNRQHQQRLL